MVLIWSVMHVAGQKPPACRISADFLHRLSIPNHRDDLRELASARGTDPQRDLGKVTRSIQVAAFLTRRGSGAGVLQEDLGPRGRERPLLAFSGQNVYHGPEKVDAHADRNAKVRRASS